MPVKGERTPQCSVSVLRSAPKRGGTQSLVDVHWVGPLQKQRAEGRPKPWSVGWGLLHPFVFLLFRPHGLPPTSEPN